MDQDFLFIEKGFLRDYLEERKVKLKKEIEDMGSDYLLKVDEDELYSYLSTNHSLEAPVLREDDIYIYGPNEVDVDVSQDPNKSIRDRSSPFYMKHTSITIAMPFDGDGELFQYRASRYSSCLPKGKIVGQEVHLIYKKEGLDTNEFKKEYMKDVDDIREHLEWTLGDIKVFNDYIESFIKENIPKRKNKLIDTHNFISELGLPIRKRKDRALTYTVPTTRKKPKIERPKVTKSTKPEPTLSMDVYEDILNIIQNMVLVMERSPQAFKNMGEEDLRQHFLVQLNGQYEGRATGETFNFSGDTDILIREGGKNIFIAECKFWKGKQDLLNSIDQLLRYTCWRDTKTAILIFNRRKKFSNVLETIQETVKNHSCYKQEKDMEGETIFRYLFHQPNDVDRDLILTVMAFDVPR